MEAEFLSELGACLDESRFPVELTDACELMECLSYGAGSETLLVRNRRDGTLYVAKCYESTHPMFAETEPEAIRSLRHPGLPLFIAEYKSDTMRCLLRQYVEGQPLSALTVPPDEETVRSIGMQLCEILTYLHEQNPPVIHRDIKPHNVIYSGNGKVSLIDFGISRLYSKQAQNDTVAFGTQAFSPPEQYGFSQTDCRSDIFSLGVLLHWLQTGNTELDRIGSSPMERVAAKCTAFDPKNRYKDGEAVLRALKRTAPKRRRRRMGLLILAALLLVLGAIAAGVWWEHYQPMNDPNHTPAFMTSKELQADSAEYLNERYATTLFEATDTTGDIGYIRTLLVNVFGYDEDYACAMPAANPPMEVPDSFLPWAFADDETLSRDMTVYMVVKIFWPEVVGNWSSLKDDTGEYPGVRVSVPFAKKKGVLEGLHRPDHLTRGDLALLLANASRAYGDELPPQLAAAASAAASAAPVEKSARGFAEPLVEQAVRAMLGKTLDDTLTADELASVGALYIVENMVLTSPREFYAAISDWYAAGRSTRGNIRTLADLELLPNVREVGVVAQELRDISALSRLRALEKVEFKHNYIHDVTTLSDCPELFSVGLNDNPVEDLSPLATCPKLRFLDLCDVRSYDPAFLDQMGDFEFLDLSNSTDSYLHLSGKTIRELKLNWTGMTTLDSLSGVDGIEALELNNSAVTDLSPLLEHPTIKRLRLGGLKVDDLSVLLKLPKLESVTLTRDMEPAVQALSKISFEIYYE